MIGRVNIAAGLWFLAGFMAYGFVLLYLRDFAPDKAQWIADYGIGKHFESRMAHVHGNLFALLNVLVGYLLLRLPITGPSGRWISGLALVGMLMPLGILAEVLFGAPPILVLIGAVSMVIAMVWLGFCGVGAESRPARRLSTNATGHEGGPSGAGVDEQPS